MREALRWVKRANRACTFTRFVQPNMCRVIPPFTFVCFSPRCYHSFSVSSFWSPSSFLCFFFVSLSLCHTSFIICLNNHCSIYLLADSTFFARLFANAFPFRQCFFILAVAKAYSAPYLANPS